MLEAWLAGDVPHDVMADWCEDRGIVFPRAQKPPVAIAVSRREAMHAMFPPMRSESGSRSCSYWCSESNSIEGRRRASGLCSHSNSRSRFKSHPRSELYSAFLPFVSRSGSRSADEARQLEAELDAREMTDDQ